jgi:hypothetical protein
MALYCDGQILIIRWRSGMANFISASKSFLVEDMGRAHAYHMQLAMNGETQRCPCDNSAESLSIGIVMT